MSLHLATVDQLIEWQRAIVDELARRASQQAAPQVVPPWASMPVPQAYAAIAQQPPVTQHYQRRQEEPPPRRALGAGEDGVGGGPQPLVTLSVPQYTPAKRPPGTIYANGSTDPELAQQFMSIPPREGG